MNGKAVYLLGHRLGSSGFSGHSSLDRFLILTQSKTVALLQSVLCANTLSVILAALWWDVCGTT